MGHHQRSRLVPSNRSRFVPVGHQGEPASRTGRAPSWPRAPSSQRREHHRRLSRGRPRAIRTNEGHMDFDRPSGESQVADRALDLTETDYCLRHAAPVNQNGWGATGDLGCGAGWNGRALCDRPPLVMAIGRVRGGCSADHTKCWGQIWLSVSTYRRARTDPVRRSPRSTRPVRSCRRCSRASAVHRRSQGP